MGLGFLTPALLAALGALAIPVIIHLYRRDKSEVTAFPSLMFLERIPYRSLRRQKIRHWLLLLLRCAALTLLVLAFARPLVRAARGPDQIFEARQELIVLLDRSFSMGYGDRWQRAVDAARQAISGMGVEDRVSLIAFDDRATVLHQSTTDRVAVVASLGTLEPSDRATAFAPALKTVRGVLVESDIADREVVLISDFQRIGLDGGELVRLPRGTRLVPVDLSTGEPANLAVTSVLLERGSAAGRERLTPSARVTNRGSESFDAVVVDLELNDRQVESREIALAADSSTTVSFESVVLEAGLTTRGVVKVGGDQLAVDNEFHFALSPAHGVSALILEGSGSRRASSLYLVRALALGQRPFYRVETMPASRLTAEDLKGRSVVVINDSLEWLEESSARRLREFVEAGGGLWIAAGRNFSASRSAAASEILSLPAIEEQERPIEGGGSLAYLDYSHAAFEPFGAPRSGDFSVARFFRYHNLAEGDSKDFEDLVLARFDDGRPAMIERRLGGGSVLVWPSTLDRYWNNLPVQPVFLPFVHQVVRYLSGYALPREWYTVGQVANLDVELEGGLEEDWLALSPSGAKMTLSMAEPALLRLEESGFYVVRPVDSQLTAAEETDGDGGFGATTGEKSLVLAVNPDYSESDLTSLDIEEFAAAIEPGPEAGAGVEPQAASTPVERERRQRLWWYLLLLAFVLLVSETFFSNRLSRRVERAVDAGIEAS